MRIIVCGGGHVGSSIAQYFSEEYEVALIDTSAAVLAQLSEKIDLQTVHGSASDPDTLALSGASRAGVLVAVTGQDEINMVACQLAHSLFKVHLKIARVRNPSFFKAKWSHLYESHHLPIDVMISPETEAARAISLSLYVPHAFEVISLADGKLQAIGIKIRAKNPVLYTPLRHFYTLFPRLNIHILRIFRKGQNMTPKDTDSLIPEDEVFFLTETSKTSEVMSAFGFPEEVSQKILILGGGKIGLRLAEEIEQNHPQLSCSLIEGEKEQAHFLVSQLSRTLVLQGDALDVDMLQEANIETVDTVVAVTDDDKINILASLLAKHYGARRSITLINRKGYFPFGVDKILNPSSLTISTILQRVRRGYIHAIHSLGEQQGELVDVNVSLSSYAVGISVQELTSKEDVHIFSVLRQGNIIFPSPEFVIQPLDRVVLTIAPDGVRKLKKLFEPRVDSI